MSSAIELSLGGRLRGATAPTRLLQMIRPGHAVITVRHARADDACALACLAAQLGFPADEATIARRLAEMQNAGEHILVAEHEGAVAGMVTLHITPVLHRPTAVGRMTALVVDEHHRAHGVGRALVAAAERNLLERGCALIEVTSNHKWTAAHAFYERLGYVITSHRFYKPLA